MTAHSPAGATVGSKFEVLVADREMSVVRYALVLGLITALPVTIVAVVAVAFGYMSFTVENLVHPWPVPGLPLTGFVIGFADSIVFSPFVESGMALVPIWILRKVRVTEKLIPLIACVFWAALHARGGHLVQWVQAWPFYCFTLVLIKHEKPSLDRAWLRASAVHAVHNSIGMLWALPVALLD